MANELLTKKNINARRYLGKLQFVFVHHEQFSVLKVMFFFNIVPFKVKKVACFFDFHSILLSLHVKNKV